MLILSVFSAIRLHNAHGQHWAEMALSRSIRALKKLIPAPARVKFGRSIRNFRRTQRPTLGVDFVKEVKSRLPYYKVQNIFDVGAHIGMTALEFSDNFPFAAVYAFEPGTDNMRRLDANLVGAPKIQRCQFALGAKPGTARLLIEPDHPSMNRLTHTEDGQSEIVAVSTIDKFCAEQGIPLIDILKIDVEGAELDVLSGASSMLCSGNIGLIKAECAVDPDCDYHISFGDICAMLHPLGYRLFGIYDQAEDLLLPLQKRSARLRRFDCAFINMHLTNSSRCQTDEL